MGLKGTAMGATGQLEIDSASVEASTATSEEQRSKSVEGRPVLLLVSDDDDVRAAAAAVAVAAAVAPPPLPSKVGSLERTSLKMSPKDASSLHLGASCCSRALACKDTFCCTGLMDRSFIEAASALEMPE